MTLRIIARIDDANMAANVGGSVFTQYRTFEIEAPEVEEFLLRTPDNGYQHRQIIGVEIVKQEPPQ